MLKFYTPKYDNSGHVFLPNYMLVLCSHKDDIHFKQNSA